MLSANSQVGTNKIVEESTAPFIKTTVEERIAQEKTAPTTETKDLKSGLIKASRESLKRSKPFEVEGIEHEEMVTKKTLKKFKPNTEETKLNLSGKMDEEEGWKKEQELRKQGEEVKNGLPHGEKPKEEKVCEMAHNPTVSVNKNQKEDVGRERKVEGEVKPSDQNLPQQTPEDSQAEQNQGEEASAPVESLNQVATQLPKEVENGKYSELPSGPDQPDQAQKKPEEGPAPDEQGEATEAANVDQAELPKEAKAHNVPQSGVEAGNKLGGSKGKSKASLAQSHPVKEHTPTDNLKKTQTEVKQQPQEEQESGGQEMQESGGQEMQEPVA